MTGFEIGAAVGTLAVAIWLKRILTVGVYIKAAMMVLAVIAAATFVGVIEVSYNPARVWELGEFLIGIVR